jgi:argininosuccinate synthase
MNNARASRESAAAASSSTRPSKVVLAYSGGLDTSVILKWLQDTYGCEVVTFTADIGQGEEVEPARQKARKLGIAEPNIHIEDLREEFVRDFVYPMFRANAVYEGEYLLGTSIARPLIAKRLVEIAKASGADAIAHGATGKGNDQVRFELGAYALAPNIRVIAPWREWDLLSREKLLAYADRHAIAVDFQKRAGAAPYSMDANLLHISYEGGVLEDPQAEPEESMWRMTVSPEKAPDAPQVVELAYRHGDIVAVDGVELTPARVLSTLNEIGGRHGVGRLDIVENRYVGMKSRGCYETPGGTLLLTAHRELEALCLERDLSHYKQQVALKYAELVYYGLWFTPLREALDAFIAETQKEVTGEVTLKLYKGNVAIGSRQSEFSLYRTDLSSFTMGESYDQKDAAGFIRILGLPARSRAKLKQRAKAEEITK